MDRIGRKPLLIIGMTGCCVSLIFEAAMVASFAEAGTNKAGLKMGVAATYIFLLFQTFSFDSTAVVLFSEIYPNHLRARGLAIVIATVAITDLVYLEVAETVSPIYSRLIRAGTDILSTGLCSYRMEVLPCLHCTFLYWHCLYIFSHSRDEEHPAGGDGGHFRR